MKNSKIVLVDTETNEIVGGLYTSINGANKSRTSHIENRLLKDCRKGLLDPDTTKQYCYSRVENRIFRGSEEAIDKLKKRIEYYSNIIHVKIIKEVIYE